MGNERVAYTPRPGNRVAAGHIPVLSAAVELVLLLVEAVHQVPGAGVRRVANAVDLVVSCRGRPVVDLRIPVDGP